MYEELDATWVLTIPYVVAASEYIKQHEIEVALGVLFVLMFGMIIFTARANGWRFGVTTRKISPKFRGTHMTGQAREAELRTLISDMVTDALEDLYFKGKITLEEKMTWQHRFGNLLDLRDLITGGRMTIVQELRMRRKHPTPVVPVPIPGPTPQETEPKNAFDAIVRRSKLKTA